VGNHRIAAAAAKGRKIDVDYQVEVRSKDDRGSGGFWAWLSS
jgi:hypothetical protein